MDLNKNTAPPVTAWKLSLDQIKQGKQKSSRTMTKRTPTLEQKKIATHARQALRAGRSIIFKGPMGIGKTLACGEIIAKPITKKYETNMAHASWYEIRACSPK